jgi:hypothetical protein
MSYTYEKHCEDCKIIGVKPMPKKHFNEMEGISSDMIVPILQIRPKNQRPISPLLKNYQKVEG